MRQLKDCLIPVLRKIYGKHHALFPDIMINWSKIVGLSYNTTTGPVKITKSKEKGQLLNVLHVQVKNNSIGTEISFRQEIIMERIAIYLGFRAIHRVHVMVYNERQQSTPNS